MNSSLYYSKEQAKRNKRAAYLVLFLLQVLLINNSCLLKSIVRLKNKSCPPNFEPPGLEKHGCHDMILPWSYHGEYESPWSYHVIAWSSCLTMAVSPGCHLVDWDSRISWEQINTRLMHHVYQRTQMWKALEDLKRHCHSVGLNWTIFHSGKIFYKWVAPYSAFVVLVNLQEFGTRLTKSSMAKS